MRVAVKFAYDGRSFSGYARQPSQRTVEQTVLNTLIENRVFQDVKHACFRTASRTDRGVSALGNVCAFDTTRTIDEILPLLSDKDSEVFFYGMHEVDPGFYPRHATQRQYRYYLRNENLKVEKILSSAHLFTGMHNFQNFARVEPLKNPVRTIDTIVITEKKDFLILDFDAQTFLWNQIRRIVSALKKVGEGSLTFNAVQQGLDHPEIPVDFQVAASEPLLLKDVRYDFSFDYVEEYKRKLQRFEQKIVSSL